MIKKKVHKIYCVLCGKVRFVRTVNWKQVKYCEACAYKRKREYNSAYVRAWRERKEELESKESVCGALKILNESKEYGSR